MPRNRTKKTLPWIKLERSGPLSMQAQIVQWLETLITKGKLTAGDQLPPEPILMENLGVSRVTLRLAIDELVARSLVSRAHGKGCFVAPAMVQHDLNSEHGFFNMLFAKANKPSAKLVAYGLAVPPQRVAAMFGLASHEKAVRVDRLFLSSNKPVVFAAGWLTPDAAELSRADVEVRSTEALHGEILHHPIATTSTSISAELADQDVAKRLGIRVKSAVLILARSRFDAQGRVREYNRFSIDPSSYEFTLSSGSSAISAALRLVAA